MKTNEAKTPLGVLTLSALGIVYGDIGTSPLYALKEVFGHSAHPLPITPENIYGILSLFFWSLILVVTIKYVCFVLRANNKGEGGIIALMTLALQKSLPGSWDRKLIVVLGLFGAALFYGDGVITPAISVLSAVEGLTIVVPQSERFVLPITIAILIGLFLFQRKGSAKVGALFGPVMIIWFAVLFVMGATCIAENPNVLLAVNPYYAFKFFSNNALIGFLAMGAVVLCVTGAEALYADMGHFGVKPIRLAWIAIVMPALLVNYFGQGALLLTDPETVKNPFYLMAADWARYPLIILATMATVIASQALISGAFSVTQQAMQLGYVPRLEIHHTSDKQIGQIYIPSVNWALLAVIIALVVGFRSSSNLAAAYGIAVTGTMLITNFLAAYVSIKVWKWNPIKTVMVIVPFVCIDVSYFLANSIKIPDGGWFPLVFGLSIFAFMKIWKQGRELLSERLSNESLGLENFLDNIDSTSIARISGTAVFMTTHPELVPNALVHSLKHFKHIHETVLVLCVKVLDQPYVSKENRLHLRSLSHGFTQVYVHYGYKDETNIPDEIMQIQNPSMPIDLMQTSFFLSRETLIPIRTDNKLLYWRKLIFVAMFRNAGSAMVFFKIPSNRVVEMGSQVHI